MKGTMFDIFSGVPQSDPVWLESVVGLLNARERMKHIAAKKPGRYFMSSIGTHSPVAEIETFGLLEASTQDNPQSAAKERFGVPAK